MLRGVGLCTSNGRVAARRRRGVVMSARNQVLESRHRCHASTKSVNKVSSAFSVSHRKGFQHSTTGRYYSQADQDTKPGQQHQSRDKDGLRCASSYRRMDCIWLLIAFCGTTCSVGCLDFELKRRALKSFCANEEHASDQLELTLYHKIAPCALQANAYKASQSIDDVQHDQAS